MTNVRAEFERCTPWIEEALKYGGGTHLAEDIWDEIVSGKLQFWPAERGCFVTEVEIYPRKRVLHIALAGGEMDQLMSMVDSLEEFAKAVDCQSITIYGRKGWSRVLRGRDVRPLYMVMAKEL